MKQDLDSAIQAFNHWRTTRIKRGPTPDHLQELAVKMASQYGRGHVAKALGIPTSSLTAWQKALTNQPHHESDHSCDFMSSSQISVE